MKPRCGGRDIAVYIQTGSERLPICRRCWLLLAKEDIEWDENGMISRGGTELPLKEKWVLESTA